MTTVAIIEDRKEIREGLQKLIAGSDGFTCAGAYRTMEDAIEGIARQLPEVALVDLGLPGMSGIEGIRKLKSRYPNLLMLVLTVYGDDERIFQALCAGACGYLLKKTPIARLLEAIEEAKAGGSPMSPEVARRVVELFRRMRPPEAAGHDLTPHEARLLKLLVQGHSYKSAAAQMGVTVHTISFHIRNVYNKLQVHSKSEAVARALQTGLV